MHIEKNVTNNILGTILDIKGKKMIMQPAKTCKK